ncbi:hypothetical protein [Alkanindiges illinoisensis]|uniref:hypothetical protein n=1 Tax=Alkanindiges illinoisensis TaxID=197183 RepID=UPI0012ECA00C|nr:hypothetical protein [Alkanindiges illinoisensis]
MSMAGCMTYAQPSAMTSIYKLEGGRVIELPNDTTIIKKDNGGDFILYDVLNADQKAILGIFVGNFPNKEGSNAPPYQQITLPNFSQVDGKKWKCEMAYCAQVYVDVTKYSKNGWPSYVHFWYNKNDESDAQEADKIINSLK